MIDFKTSTEPDYECSGNLYHIEIVTEDFESYRETLELLMSLQEKQKERKRRQIYGK
jgi:hypothetical protein